MNIEDIDELEKSISLATGKMLDGPTIDTISVAVGKLTLAVMHILIDMKRTVDES